MDAKPTASKANPRLQWLNKLNYFQDEVRYFQNRLAEVAANSTKAEISKLADKFKDDFSRAIQEIDQYRSKLRAEARPSDEAGASRILDQTKELERFVRSYTGLRNCFDMFLSDLHTLKN